MRIPASAVYVCTFPEFDDCSEPVEIEARDAQEAAVRAAGWWEESIDDYRVLRGEETLRVQVQAHGEFSVWEVLGERGRYVAKAVSEV
jgi:hypothetical protein